jgi:uncharacterized protein
MADQLVNNITEALRDLSNDRGLPRNVKAVIEEAIKEMHNSKDTVSARINTAISMLDQCSNDPNIPGHIRTQVWNVVSMLESTLSQVE